MKQLHAYFDYGSPYAYLAWQRITNVHPERYENVDVLWKPVSAGHIFAQDGTRPNTLMHNQKAYLHADVRRWATAYGVPFGPPEDGHPGAMPVRSIEAMRLHFVADHQGPDVERAWMNQVFHAYFRDGQDISDMAVLHQLATETGLEGAAEGAGRESVKKLLIANTTEAYRAGAPGVPFFILDGEPFWGNDRLSMVEERLATAE